MTPGVNLLPVRYVERNEERRQAAVTSVALVVLLAVILLTAVSQGRELRQVEAKRDVEQTRTGELNARRAKLARFRELPTQIVGRERLLAAAMNPQVAWSVVLSSLSATFPADASLTSLTAESELASSGPAPSTEPGGATEVIGSTTLTGYSVNEFTPGVQRTLQLLDTVTGLSEPRLQVGTAELLGKSPVTTFEGSTFVDRAALSGRYADGLPAEDHVDVPSVSGARPAGAAAPAPAEGASE